MQNKYGRNMIDEILYKKISAGYIVPTEVICYQLFILFLAALRL
jgi:hypothetical protein